MTTIGEISASLPMAEVVPAPAVPSVGAGGEAAFAERLAVALGSGAPVAAQGVGAAFADAGVMAGASTTVSAPVAGGLGVLGGQSLQPAGLAQSGIATAAALPVPAVAAETVAANALKAITTPQGGAQGEAQGEADDGMDEAVEDVALALPVAELVAELVAEPVAVPFPVVAPMAAADRAAAVAVRAEARAAVGGAGKTPAGTGAVDVQAVAVQTGAGRMVAAAEPGLSVKGVSAELAQAKPEADADATEGDGPRADAAVVVPAQAEAAKVAVPAAVTVAVVVETVADGVAARSGEAPVIDAQVQVAPQAQGALPVEARAMAQVIRTDATGWEQVLTERIAAELSGDGKEIELTLSPEKLGALRIKLEMVDGSAQVRIITATPEAARVFTEAQHRLSEGLTRAGIDLGSQSAESGRQGGQADDRAAPRGRMSEILTQTRRAEAGEGPTFRRAGAGLVNLMA